MGRLLMHEKIAVIGAGLIGRPWAIVFARAGCRVALYDAAPQDAVLAQENVTETINAKRQIFTEMDRLAASDAILASSTSWIPASVFSKPLPGRVGQSPVVLKKEITGFLLNRIQDAVLNEALNLYENGSASAEDLDKVLKDGLGLRWFFMGPFETMDLNAPAGMLDYVERYGHSFRNVAKTHLPNEWHAAILQKIVAERRAALRADQLEARARWRDNRLMELAAYKRKQPL